MEEEKFIQSLIKKAEIVHIFITEDQAKLFYQYMVLLVEWNEKINLTAITEPEEIILKHFIDSLTILPFIEENKKILDIGTGAGFPGIPLKIVSPSSNVTLLDSLNKRILFLNEVMKELSLENIYAVHGRAEDFAQNNRENYDIVVSRAVARLNVLLEYMLPLTKIGGKAICMKAFDIEEELEEAKKAIQILGGELEKIEEIKLPETDIVRKIMIIRKIKSTPNQYPRKAGIPVKKPII